MDERRKWKNVNNEEGRKEELHKTKERIEKSHRQGQEAIS
jgi:hypothetical protein